MKPVDRKRLMPSSGVRVRLQGYPGKPRRRPSPARSFGVVVLIVTAVGVAAVFRHLPRGAGEGKPTAAPAARSDVSKPQQRVPASRPASPRAVSPDPAVRTKSTAPAASPPRPDAKVDPTRAPSTTTHAVPKAANSTATAGSAPKAAPGTSVTGDPLILRGGARRYHVRVGAFADRSPAEELATRLRGLGYAARIEGARPFLVLVGGYLDEPTAGRLVSHLRGQGFDAVMVSSNAPQ
jgi:cell division septation protein DedD